MPFFPAPAIWRRTSVLTIVLCAVVVSTLALSGCASRSVQHGADRFDGRHHVIRGLVVPGDAYVGLAGGERSGEFDAWLAARNNDEVNPRPAAYPWSFQFVELRQRENLKIINGRPRGYTTSETRTYRLQRRR